MKTAATEDKNRPAPIARNPEEKNNKIKKGNENGKK